MRWLTTTFGGARDKAGLWPFVLFAAAASLMLNVLLLAAAAWLMQAFQYVFTGRSLETLVLLSSLVALALALACGAELARARLFRSWPRR